MGNESMEITTTDNWKPKALVIGGVVGAAVGIAAAYLLVQRSKDDGRFQAFGWRRSKNRRAGLWPAAQHH